jgi:hypothetical protein
MLNKHNLEIARLASKEESRYVIGGILVTPAETVVTDGHCLVTVSTPKWPAESFPVIDGVVPTEEFEPFILPAKAALEIAKAIPSSTSLLILQHVIVGEEGKDSKSAVLATTDLDLPRVFRPRKLEGRFPDHKLVIPGRERVSVAICLNLELLEKVVKELKALAKNKLGAPALISVIDDRSPCMIEVQGEDGQTAQAVIMPINLDRGEKIAGHSTHGVKNQRVTIVVDDAECPGAVYSNGPDVILVNRKDGKVISKDVLLGEHLLDESSIPDEVRNFGHESETPATTELPTLAEQKIVEVAQCES